MDKRMLENARVKKNVEEAFFFLLKKRTFSEITATEIIRTAGIARSSYYRNFHSKEDIIASYMERQRLEVANEISFCGSADDFFDPEKLVKSLEHFLTQKYYFLLLYDNGFGAYLQENENHFAEICLGDMPCNSPERYKIYFMSGALFNMTMKWLRDGAKESPHEMAAIFLKLLNPSISADLDGASEPSKSNQTGSFSG